MAKPTKNSQKSKRPHKRSSRRLAPDGYPIQHRYPLMNGYVPLRGLV